MRLRADSARLRHEFRTREIQALFRRAPEDAFDRALELGAGDGFQSRLLVRHTRSLLSTDINPDRLQPEPHPKIEYGVCDAEDLPYRDREFDLIFSSNLLEHLEDPVAAVARMALSLRDNGIMVHTVPNRFWKALHMGLFYPSQLLSLVERATGQGQPQGPRFDNNARAVPRGDGRASFLRRRLWPPPHGVSGSNMQEFVRFGRGYWTGVFAEAGLELVGTARGLPAHSPYRFGYNGARRLFERAGFSSCTGYILRKAGHESPYQRLFVGGSFPAGDDVRRRRDR